MDISSDGSEAPAPTPPVVDAIQPTTLSVPGQLETLRSALAQPKESRGEGWEEKTSRFVALLAVDYLKQTDDRLALEEVALVTLAGLRGVKAAKKKVLSVARWQTSPPPHLTSVFAETDEVRAAVRALSPLQSEWVVRYVAEAIAGVDAAAIGELLDWASRSQADLGKLVGALRDYANNVGEGRGWLRRATVACLKHERLRQLQDPATFLEELCATLAVLKAGVGSDVHEKEWNELETMSADALDFVTALFPSLCISSSVPAFVETLSSSEHSLAPPSRASLIRLVQRTADVVRLVRNLAAEADREATRAVARALLDALPKDLRSHPRASDLESLLLEVAPRTQETAESSLIQTQIADLLAEVDDLIASDAPHEARLQLLDHVQSIAQLVGVRRFGQIGEELRFEPLRHHLAEPAERSPTRVRVLKPGVEVVRGDGSARVVLKCLVAPFSDE